jgi:methionine synthase I (cobalamin-dependent)
MQSAFVEQATALTRGGADAIVVETMADLEEAKLAVAAARVTGLPVVACMVFDSGKNLDRTMMGITPEQAAQELSEAGADVIGANCGQGIAGFLPICQRLRAVTDQPIWIKPNAGLPQLVDGRAVYAGTPADFASQVSALIAAGANFIGGCCGTSPEYISAICRRLPG